MPLFDVLIEDTSALPYQVPPAGQHIMTTFGAGMTTNGTFAQVADRLSIAPFLARATMSVDQASVIVTAGVAGALGRVVLYASESDGYPAGLLLESGDLDLAAAATVATAFAVTLQQGVTYWIGMATSSTPILSTWASSAVPDIQGGTPSATARKSVRRTVAYSSAAPSIWGAFNQAEVSAVLPVAIWLRRA